MGFRRGGFFIHSRWLLLLVLFVPALPVILGGTSPLAGVAAISAGGFYTCAVLLNNTVRCWGNNIHGQLGNGNITDSSLPISALLQQRFLPSVFK